MQALLLMALLASPLDGVKTIAAPGLPGNVVLWKAGQPLVVDRDGRIMAASVDTGAGRILAIGHNGFLGAYKTADSGTFLRQSVNWLGFGKPTKVICSHSDLAGYLQGQSGWPDWNGGRGEVAVVDAHQVNPKDIPAIQAYIRGGGGLLIAATGWGWQQGSGLSMDQFSANKALAPFGIGFGEGFLEKDANGFDATRSPRPESGGEPALRVLEGAPGDGPLAVQTLTDIMNVLPPDSRWLSTNALKSAPFVMSAKRPLAKSQFRDRFEVAYRNHLLKRGERMDLGLPYAAEFPGVPKAPFQGIKAQEITLRPNETRWQSTGLYADPMHPVQVSFPQGLKLGIRVGAHTDNLWHLDKWERFPEISREWRLTPNGSYRL